MEVVKIAHLSDLHIKQYKDPLEQMIGMVNADDLDVVVITGDLVHDKDDIASFKKAAIDVGKIKHRTVVLPGEYDSGKLWSKYFGARYSSLEYTNVVLVFVDTSFMGHRFASGWDEHIKREDPEQYEWLRSKLESKKYCMVFSHHPFLVSQKEEKHELLRDNVRAMFAGHLRRTFTAYFNYDVPAKTFSKGLIAVPMNFHGIPAYVKTDVKPDGGLVQTSRVVK